MLKPTWDTHLFLLPNPESYFFSSYTVRGNFPDSGYFKSLDSWVKNIYNRATAGHWWTCSPNEKLGVGRSHSLTLYNEIIEWPSNFPGGSVNKEATCIAEDPGSISRGRSPGEGNGNPFPSILVWEIPWAEEPGRFQSIGLQELEKT